MNPRRLAPALVLFLSTPAMAWKHTGNVWTADQMPVVFYVADGENNEDGNCQDDVPVGYCLDAAVSSANKWNDVPCTDLVVQIDPEPIENDFTNQNGINEIVFEDPANAIETAGDPGVLAWSQGRDNGTMVEVNGQLYGEFDDADITFGKDRNMQAQELLEQSCFDENNFESTMLHEMGHSLGLGHSCDEEDVCVAPELREATMFWISGGACDFSKSLLAQDDFNGLQALYGPIATFSCAGENDNGAVLGVVPFDLSCVITSNRIPDVTGVEWVWGDGGVSDGLVGGHKYESAGNYTISVTVDGESDACGDDGASGTWSYSYRRVGYITACDVVQGEFSAEFVDDLTYKMVNRSDVSVYGCISEIQWAVYEGEGVSGEPIQTYAAWDPEIEFPERGTYTIQMNLGGPGGTSGSTLTVDVSNSAGCDTTSAAGSAGLLGLLGLLGLGRRRD